MLWKWRLSKRCVCALSHSFAHLYSLFILCVGFFVSYVLELEMEIILILAFNSISKKITIRNSSPKSLWSLYHSPSCEMATFTLFLNFQKRNNWLQKKLEWDLLWKFENKPFFHLFTFFFFFLILFLICFLFRFLSNSGDFEIFSLLLAKEYATCHLLGIVCLSNVDAGSFHSKQIPPTYTHTQKGRQWEREWEWEKMKEKWTTIFFVYHFISICCEYVYICVCSLKGGPEFGLNAPYLVVGFVTGEMGFSFTLWFLYFWYDSIILYNIISSSDSVNYMHALSSESIVQTFLRQLDVMFGNESDWQPGRLIDCSSLLLSMCLIACDYLLWWLRSLLLMEVNFFVWFSNTELFGKSDLWLDKSSSYPQWIQLSFHRFFWIEKNSR